MPAIEPDALRALYARFQAEALADAGSLIREMATATGEDLRDPLPSCPWCKASASG